MLIMKFQKKWMIDKMLRLMDFFLTGFPGAVFFAGRLARNCDRIFCASQRGMRTGAVISDDGGLPAWTARVGKIICSQDLEAAARVVFPTASGPKKTITAPPDRKVLF